MTQCTGPIELNTMGQKQDTLNKRMCKGLNSEVNRGEKNLFIVNKNLLRLTLEEGCDRVFSVRLNTEWLSVPRRLTRSACFKDNQKSQT